MTNDEAKDILRRFLDGQKIKRGDLLDAFNLASREVVKEEGYDEELVALFDELTERIGKGAPQVK